MKQSKRTRQRRIELYKKQADEHDLNTPDWHYWMQFVEHWRRVNQDHELSKY